MTANINAAVLAEVSAGDGISLEYSGKTALVTEPGSPSVSIVRIA